MAMIQLTLEGKPIEFRPYRHITIKEQTAFCDFLFKLGIFSDKIAKLFWCSSEFIKYDCTNEPGHPKKVKYLACGLRGYCPRCSMAYAHKRAESMYQWIKQNIADNLNFDLKMNQIVLTLPKELHENLDRKTFSKMIRYFISNFGIEAYGYSIQFRHSKNPLDTRFLHAHVLTLNIKESNNKIIENEYFFDLDSMRDLWTQTIEKFTDVSVSGQVDIFTEYASIKKKKAKAVHLLAYLYRYSIQDLFNVQVRNSTHNYLESEQFETDYTILQIEAMQKEPKSLTWCGLLTSTKREYLECLLQNTINELVIWKNINYFVKQLDERSKTCRDCGFPYSEIPCDRGKYQGDNEPF